MFAVLCLFLCEVISINSLKQQFLFCWLKISNNFHNYNKFLNIFDNFVAGYILL